MIAKIAILLLLPSRAIVKEFFFLIKIKSLLKFKRKIGLKVFYNWIY